LQTIKNKILCQTTVVTQKETLLMKNSLFIGN